MQRQHRLSRQKYFMNQCERAKDTLEEKFSGPGNPSTNGKAQPGFDASLLNGLSLEKPPRILVIDDNRAIHDDFRKIFASRSHDALDALENELFGERTTAARKMEFELDFASQGQEGFEMVKLAIQSGRPYALAFMDVRMPPGWDGIETTAQIWKVEPDLQLVICTAYSDYSWEEMINQLGHSDKLVILKKPFDNIEVLQLASALTEKWKLMQQARAKMDVLEKMVKLRTREQEIMMEELTAFSNLGQKLSSAKTAREAGEIIVGVADQLFGWDACSFYLYSPENNRVYHILTSDIVDGRRANCSPVYDGKEPGVRARQVIKNGAQLTLKEPPYTMSSEVSPFGDTSRPSASIMAVPVRNGSNVIGVLSIHSYTPKAYTPDDLKTFQSLADHCGSALDRIQAEEARTKLAQQMQLLLQSTGEGVYGIDLNGACTFINRAGAEMVGGQPEEILGQNMHELLHHHKSDGSSCQTNRCPIFRSLRLGERCRVDHEVLWHRDGTSFPAEYASFPIMENGAIKGAVVTFNDITGRKQLEEQYRQAQKMEAIGQLAGGVAHDFNNILTVINGYSAMLVNSYEALPEQAELLKEISAAGERAAKLTHQLLIFSRKQTMRLQPADLNEIVGSMSKMLRRLIGENISLHFNNSPGVQPILADAGMVEQVLLNLAVNARDAMPKGGRFTINTEAKTISDHDAQNNPEARAGKFVCLSVQDSGCGMSPEILTRIFEPFFTTKETGKGTGLGLATVFGIVKQHEGWITVRSQVDVGTTFEVFLPVASAVAAQNSENVSKAVAGGHETILLVEDEAAVRALAATVLQKCGYRILQAANGAEALEVWKAHAPGIDLLLTDMVMPGGLTGWELAEKLLADKPKLKVIYSTGYSEDMTGDISNSKVKIHLLQKPYHPQKLATTVREELDGFKRR